MRDATSAAVRTVAAICLSSAFAVTACAQTVQVPGMESPLGWIHAPRDYQLTKTGIVITAPERSDKYIWSGGGHAPDNAPRLVFDNADRDFIFSTAVSHTFASKYDAGGLFVEADAKHWFKFEFERDYTGAHRIVSVVTNDYSDDANSMEIESDTAYLQVARMGDAFALYVSKDGKGWYLVRIFHFKHTGSLKVGLIAQSPEGQGATIRFSDLKYGAKRIKDIWKGE
jgi:uncharacterized protein